MKTLLTSAALVVGLVLFWTGLWRKLKLAHWLRVGRLGQPFRYGFARNRIVRWASFLTNDSFFASVINTFAFPWHHSMSPPTI